MSAQTPIHVLFVLPALGAGGAERDLLERLPFFEKESIVPTIACLHPQEIGLQKEFASQGHEIYFLRGRGLLAKIISLRQVLHRRRPDLIHTMIVHADVVGRLAAVGTSIPVISSLLTMEYDPITFRRPGTSALWHRAVQEIDSWTARYLATHIHANSKTMRDYAVHTMQIAPEKITLIQNGRNPDRLGRPSPLRRHMARRRMGIADSRRVIVNVGRQDYRKNQEILLRAVSARLFQQTEVVLLIAGHIDNATTELERLHRQLDLGERVRFLGYRDDVPEILAAADLFAFPSLSEGSPGALIEAMAVGLPIVASDIPAHREMLEHGGNALLVDPESGVEVATAISTLLERPDVARSFGARSREIFEERYTLQKEAYRMIDFYRYIVATFRK